MAEYHELKHPRKISNIEDGEIANYGSSDGGTTWHPIKCDSSGQLVLSDLSQYSISDIDDSGDPAYYGFLDKDGGWYILEENVANGTYRYDSGTSDYSTNWTGRAGLAYQLFSLEF